jgi:hypothetical protein
MAQGSGSRVVPFDTGRRDRRRFDDLIAEARCALVEVEAGDLTAIYTAHLAIGRAVAVLQREGNRWDAA